MQGKKYVIRCRAIILHEGKLLVVRHSHDITFVALPGGHLEWGEDPKECLSREIVEELGVEPQIGRLLYVNTFEDKNLTQPVEFFFEVLNGQDFVNLEGLERTHIHEINEIVWVSPTTDVRILPDRIAKDLRAGTLFSDEPRFIKG
ncbi:MAG: hydrolase [Parcubacteria group bacterium]|nr:hydrolase [Parcubacteria group bacterium]